MKKVQLTDGGILLRTYEMKDVEQLHSAARESLEELSPWMPWCHNDYNVEESRRWIEMCIKDWQEETAYQFAIIDLKNGDFLGGCGLNHINKTDKVANLGYWVRSSRMKNGIATAATLLLADFGFKELKLNRIEIKKTLGCNPKIFLRFSSTSAGSGILVASISKTILEYYIAR